MGVCGFCLIGKKHEIEKLGEICNKVGALLEAKYNKGAKGFFNWTGISIFEIFQKPDDYIILDPVADGKNCENEKAMDCIGCGPWKKDEAAIWWWEIAWPHRIPSEVWQMLRHEGKRHKVWHLVNQMIRDLNQEDDVVFDHLEKRFSKRGSEVKYPPYPF